MFYWHEDNPISWVDCGEHGVHVDPSKIQVIHDRSSPTTITEFYSFLGLTNFCQRFVFGFSQITWPFIQVTKGGSKVKFV